MTTAETHEFTDLKLKVVSGVSMGLPNREIAQKLGITEDVIQNTKCSIYDKAGVCCRLELVLWVRTALNGELRRRLRPQRQE